MNDDELSRRLRDELHGRIIPPDVAPEAVHEHLRSLSSMEEIRATGSAPGRRISRDLFGLAAAAAVVALVVAGVLWRDSGPPAAGGATPSPAATPSRSPFLWTPGPTAMNIPPRASTIFGAGRSDSTTGWAEITRPDGSVYMVFTHDAGSTWSEPHQIEDGSTVEFLDATHGWQVSEVWGTSPLDRSSNLAVSRTTDGGASWQSATVGPGTSLNQIGGFVNLTVHFRDPKNGVVLFAYGGGRADVTHPAEASPAPDVCESFSSSDGGATWSAPTAGLCLAGPTFVSSTLGYAHVWVHAPDIYSLSPDLYVTTDGGRTWTRAQLPEGWRPSPAYSSTAIYFMQERSDGTIRALCGCGPQTGESSGPALGINLISSSDGGLTWTSLGSPQGLDGTHAWMVGAVAEDQWIGADFDGLTLISSSDGGLSWRKVEPVGLPAGAEPRQWSIWDGGWAVVTTQICGPEFHGVRTCITDTSTLYSTSDGGKTWTKILTP